MNVRMQASRFICTVGTYRCKKIFVETSPALLKLLACRRSSGCRSVLCHSYPNRNYHNW